MTGPMVQSQAHRPFALHTEDDRSVGTGMGTATATGTRSIAGMNASQTMPFGVTGSSYRRGREHRALPEDWREHREQWQPGGLPAGPSPTLDDLDREDGGTRTDAGKGIAVSKRTAVPPLGRGHSSNSSYNSSGKGKGKSKGNSEGQVGKESSGGSSHVESKKSRHRDYGT